jgi:hypothetical protein
MLLKEFYELMGLRTSPQSGTLPFATRLNAKGVAIMANQKLTEHGHIGNDRRVL